MSLTSYQDPAKSLEKISFKSAYLGAIVCICILAAVLLLSLKANLGNDGPAVGFIMLYGVMMFAFLIFGNNKAMFGTIYGDEESNRDIRIKIFIVSACLYSILGLCVLANLFYLSMRFFSI